MNQVSATIREIESHLLDGAGEKPKILTSKDILDAKIRDWIRRLVVIKQGKVDKVERNVKLLLIDIDKLEVGTDGLLKRGTAEKRQLILAIKFKPLVDLELHVKTVILGRTVLQLTKEHFYWPKMEDDINHFMPNIYYELPMKIITSSAPLELIRIDFLNLDSCSGGYQYLLVITDHFTRFTQVYPTTKKVQILELISSKMILSCDTALPKRILKRTI